MYVWHTNVYIPHSSQEFVGVWTISFINLRGVIKRSLSQYVTVILIPLTTLFQQKLWPSRYVLLKLQDFLFPFALV